MHGLRLYKKEKLCSIVAIEQLFSRCGKVRSAMAFPVRAVWRHNAKRHSDAPIAFVISVPKKRLRHAVDRVTMRRRIREAYRLCRPDFPLCEGVRIDLAFVYVANSLQPYHTIDRAVRRIMAAVQSSAPTLLQDESAQ